MTSVRSSGRHGPASGSPGASCKAICISSLATARPDSWVGVAARSVHLHPVPAWQAATATSLCRRLPGQRIRPLPRVITSVRGLPLNRHVAGTEAIAAAMGEVLASIWRKGLAEIHAKLTWAVLSYPATCDNTDSDPSACAALKLPSAIDALQLDCGERRCAQQRHRAIVGGIASQGAGAEGACLMHGRRCSFSLASPSNCKCECGGRLHGSAWWSAPPGAQSAPSRQGKAARAVALTITATVAITVGAVIVTTFLSSSSTGDERLSVQVNADLNKALGELTVIGFRRARNPDSDTSGPSYRADCSQSATGEVRQFLTRHPCKQYAIATRTVTKRGTTALVAFSWVEMPTSALAGKYKTTVDTQNTGNPPGVSLAFNGLCYASGRSGLVVWSVQVQPTGHVNADREILQAATLGRLSSSYLRQHCIS
jgi:hypothetical protein